MWCGCCMLYSLGNFLNTALLQALQDRKQGNAEVLDIVLGWADYVFPKSGQF